MYLEALAEKVDKDRPRPHRRVVLKGAKRPEETDRITPTGNASDLIGSKIQRCEAFEKDVLPFLSRGASRELAFGYIAGSP